jgi:2-polyprenyl-3-methyl-5-hydroxy-6-metoxy-1,4-benzoquinol methylase
MIVKELEIIAENYHKTSDIKDKFIEDISQKCFCSWVKEHFKCNKFVCEMGYGEGITANLLNEHFNDYLVIEGAPSLVRKALRTNPQLMIKETLFENFVPEENFDLILALHVLEHVNEPLEILQMMRQWIKPDGEIIILVPNRNSIHRLLAKEMGLIQNLDDLSARDHLVGHQRVYDLDSLKTDAKNAGFEVVKEAGFFLKPLPNSMMLDFNHDLLMAMNSLSSVLPPTLMANICLSIAPTN